jgi:hypothetical protein
MSEVCRKRTLTRDCVNGLQRVASTHSLAVNADVRRGRTANVGKATGYGLTGAIPEGQVWPISGPIDRLLLREEKWGAGSRVRPLDIKPDRVATDQMSGGDTP